MKKFVFGVAAVLAATAGAAHAQTGYVGANYTNTDVDGLGSADAWGASGAVALTSNFAVDGSVSDNDGDTAWGVAGHLFANNGGSLFGGFLTYADDSVSSLWGGGIEGQYEAGQWTFAGALGYGRDDDFDVDTTGVNGEARYFLDDNFRLEGGVGLFRVNAPGGDDDALTLGVGGEFQFDAAPVSVGLSYTHASLNEADVDADAVSATVRWNFGGSLRDRDRSGAGLAGLSGVNFALGL